MVSKERGSVGVGGWEGGLALADGRQSKEKWKGRKVAKGG